MRRVEKQLLFPVRGVECDIAHHDVEPREGRTFPAPFAMNVRGRCSVEHRRRGGSRPGFAVVGDVTSDGGGTWKWPDGSAILWPTGAAITFPGDGTYFAPDGSRVIDPHALPRVSASKGNAPSGVSIATIYRDRVFAASGSDWFCSRIGDATDWDYGGDRDDPSRASAGNCAVAGAKGDTIKAFMPVYDAWLYIATSRSLWCMEADPCSGSFRCISPSVGASGPAAWCWTGRRLFFLSKNGLYGVSPGEAPVHVSEAIPQISGDAGSFIGYDPEEDALHVFTTGGDWYVELEGERPAFWPVSFETGKRPAAACRMTVGGTDKAAFRCADGAWRMFSASTVCEMPSKVAIGPFRVSASDDMDGMLAEIHLATGVSPSVSDQNASVSMKIYMGKSAEDAEHAAASGTSPSGTFSFAAGWNAVWRPRARGAWCVAVIECQRGRWAFEALRAVMRHTGRIRP